MKRNVLLEKGMTIFVGAFYLDRWRLILPAIVLLTILMFIDYMSGMFAAKKESLEHPNNKKYGWSSKKSIIGIYKKVGYIITIFATISIDYLIFKFCGEMGIEFSPKTFLGLLVTLWLIVNELISILENVGRMGVKLPKFIKDVLAELENDIDSNTTK